MVDCASYVYNTTASKAEGDKEEEQRGKVSACKEDDVVVRDICPDTLGGSCDEGDEWGFDADVGFTPFLLLSMGGGTPPGMLSTS